MGKLSEMTRAEGLSSIQRSLVAAYTCQVGRWELTEHSDGQHAHGADSLMERQTAAERMKTVV